MKKIKIIIAILAFAIVGAVIYSCTKENEFAKEVPQVNLYSITKGNGSIDPMTTDLIISENGMLSFDSYRTFDAVYKALKNLSSDSLFYTSVYNELGYNLLGSNGNEYHEPQNAVLDKFEKRFQYNSFRKIENNRFINYLNQGGDPKDYQESFLYDEFLMALLNSKMEVRIGGYYFKFIDDANCAVISDGDYSKVQELDGKTMFQINDRMNVQIINFIDPGTPDIFEKGSNGDGISMLFPCIPNFNFKKLTGHSWEFENVSFIPWGCKNDPTLKFIWDFGDGTQYEGKNPPIHTYNANGYPYTVTLKIKGNCCDKSVSKKIDIACYVDFDIKHFNSIFGGYPNGNGVYFIIKKPAPDLYNYHWDFGDGETFDGHTNTNNFGWVSHLYEVSADDSYTVCLTITAKDGSCSQTICKRVFVGCGHVYAIDDDQKDFPYDGRTWRIAGKIWCKNNFIYKTVGAYTKSFRKGNISGIWWLRNADNLEVRLKDDFIDVTETPDYIDENGVPHQGGDEVCLQIDIDKSKAENNTSKIELNAEDYFTIHKPRFFDNHLVSYHKLKLGNTIVEIPALYLTN